MKVLYGNSYYLHISALHQLQEVEKLGVLNKFFQNTVWPNFVRQDGYKYWGLVHIRTDEYAPLIVKFDIKGKKVSIIYVPNWVNEKEPEIQGIIVYKFNGEINYIQGKGQIYHSKELFVDENYKAFDIEKAKQRTVLWKSKLCKGESRKIGYKKYWKEFLKRHNMEI